MFAYHVISAGPISSTSAEPFASQSWRTQKSRLTPSTLSVRIQPSITSLAACVRSSTVKWSTRAASGRSTWE
jgi:hypothetical protein